MPQEIDPHRQHLVTLRKLINDAEADPQQADVAKRLQEAYEHISKDVPVKQLTLKATITVPAGLEARGREELIEYIRRIVIQDEHDELLALISESQGDPEKVPDYIWEDYDQHIDDLAEEND